GSLIAGATAWVMACQFDQFARALDLRAVLSALIVATFIWLTAFEFWRGRAERLVSRWPAIAILVAYGGVFLFRMPSGMILPSAVSDPAFSSAWLTVISAES